MRSDIIKISTKGMSRQEWLEERRNAIGGSDTSAILGLNPYATPYTVWADKTGRLPEKEDSEAMRQGRDFEQYVADRFTEVSGKKTRRVNAILKSAEYPFASANIDRDIVGEDSGLECKTTSVLNLRNFRDGDFPAQYYTQSVHYLAVTGYTRWYVAVLILNKGFLIYQLTRKEGDTVPDWCESSVYVSDDEVAALMDAEREFWAFVESDTPPAVTGAETDGKAFYSQYFGNSMFCRNNQRSAPTIQSIIGDSVNRKLKEEPALGFGSIAGSIYYKLTIMANARGKNKREFAFNPKPNTKEELQ